MKKKDVNGKTNSRMMEWSTTKRPALAIEKVPKQGRAHKKFNHSDLIAEDGYPTELLLDLIRQDVPQHLAESKPEDWEW